MNVLEPLLKATNDRLVPVTLDLGTSITKMDIGFHRQDGQVVMAIYESKTSATI
jgi:hypothetical protein